MNAASVQHLDLRTASRGGMSEAFERFDRDGVVVVAGVEHLAAALRCAVARTVGLPEQQVVAALSRGTLPPAIRRRLSSVVLPDAVTQVAHELLGPVLADLVGPWVQFSGSFHVQVKLPGRLLQLDHGSYNEDGQHLEVHQPYRLHQDFGAASFPTSPSAVTVWVPLESSAGWPLRVLLGTHRRGLLAGQWLDPDTTVPGSPAVDIPAVEGTCVLFHALALHGTSRVASAARISCDFRALPLCPFVSSPPLAVSRDPVAELELKLNAAPLPSFAAALLEQHLVLHGTIPAGQPVATPAARWVDYLAAVLARSTSVATAAFDAMVCGGAGAAELAELRGRLGAIDAEDLAMRVARLRRSLPGNAV